MHFIWIPHCSPVWSIDDPGISPLFSLIWNNHYQRSLAQCRTTLVSEPFGSASCSIQFVGTPNECVWRSGLQCWLVLPIWNWSHWAALLSSRALIICPERSCCFRRYDLVLATCSVTGNPARQVRNAIAASMKQCAEWFDSKNPPTRWGTEKAFAATA